MFFIFTECPILSAPDNGTVSHQGNNTDGLRSVAVYECNTGSVLIGYSKRTCQYSGQWSGTEPECRHGNTSIILQEQSFEEHKYAIVLTCRQVFSLHNLISILNT